MLQQTLSRVAHLSHPSLIVANWSHLDDITAQVSESVQLVGEPEARNTAPAVAAAALLTAEEDVLLVLPADHHIEDRDAFRATIAQAETGAREGYLVTFGIVPDRPEAGYGYIVRGDPHSPGFLIDRFVEKPDLDSAQQLIAEGALWNGGMFAFQAGVVLAELERHAPQVLDAARRAVESSSRRGTAIMLGEEFGEAPSLSIDVAVMERTEQGLVIPLDAGWSDAGSWESLYDLGPVDAAHNVVLGDVVIEGVTNSYLRSEGPLVAVLGVDDLVVVATNDAVLVSSRERAQDVKALVERLQSRPEVTDPPPAQPTNR